MTALEAEDWLKLQRRKTELHPRAEIAEAEAERQTYEEACESETGESFLNNDKATAK